MADLVLVLTTVPVFASILRVPFAAVAPMIVVSCAIGAYAIQNVTGRPNPIRGMAGKRQHGLAILAFGAVWLVFLCGLTAPGPNANVGISGFRVPQVISSPRT